MRTTDGQPGDASDIGQDHPTLAFSIVRDDAAFRWQRRVGLIPSEGLGIVRRALFFSAICWLPIALWAIATGHAFPTRGEHTLASHFGIHVRSLVAIPLLILAEHTAHQSIRQFLHYLLESGLVSVQDAAQFRSEIDSIARLKDWALPWALIVGAAIAWAGAGILFPPSEDAGWIGQSGQVPFGGWWFILVVRPIFTALLMAWLWRAYIIFALMLKIAKFPLSLVPTHPDRAGGLAFVERLAFVFSPVTFAISAVVAAAFAHEVIYHGAAPLNMKTLMIGAAVLISIVFLLPFSPLIITLARLKRRALLQYGSLVGNHGRIVHRRWIDGHGVGSPAILDAPELGPVADVQSIYEAVRRIKSFPFTKLGLLAVAAPAAAPMVLVTVIKLPLSAVVGKILKALL
ncbi:hypothetical protein PQQ88_32950 [Paraburkholderia caledonica]|jgi:hypothetical protein|uniref:hypothetical protein n=1 Tax=Paraburkholderia caledonica TaxID=134536 RepID=UPI0038B7BCF3